MGPILAFLVLLLAQENASQVFGVPSAVPTAQPTTLCVLSVDNANISITNGSANPNLPSTATISLNVSGTPYTGQVQLSDTKTGLTQYNVVMPQIITATVAETFNFAVWSPQLPTDCNTVTVTAQ